MRRGNPLRTRIGLTRGLDDSVSAPRINKLNSTSKSPLQQSDLRGNLRSKYSPSLKHYDQSRSLSAISHMNSNINEELREKIDIVGLVDRLISEVEPKIQQKHIKLINYIDDFSKRKKALSFKKDSEEQLKVMEERELKLLEKEEFSFLERKNLTELYIKELQEKMEDREIIYRAIYKQISNPQTLDKFLYMKSQEIERENKKVKEECEREIKDLEYTEKHLDKKRRYLDENLTEEEAKWLHKKHQMILRYEEEGRSKMAEKAHEVLLNFLRENVMEQGFIEKEAEFVKWIKKWEENKKKIEQAEIFSNRVRLQEEIYKMERRLEMASRDRSIENLRKSGISGHNHGSKILDLSGNLGFIDSGRTNSIHVNNGGRRTPSPINRSSHHLGGNGDVRVSRTSKNRSFVHDSGHGNGEKNYFKFR